MKATWTIDQRGTEATVTVEGAVDVAVEDELVAAVDAVFGEGAGTVIVDLGAVEFMDSAGLKALLRLRKSHGEQLVVGRRSPSVDRLFDVAGVNEWLGGETAS